MIKCKCLQIEFRCLSTRYRVTECREPRDRLCNSTDNPFREVYVIGKWLKVHCPARVRTINTVNVFKGVVRGGLHCNDSGYGNTISGAFVQVQSSHTQHIS